jgi:hypothetical protein
VRENRTKILIESKRAELHDDGRVSIERSWRGRMTYLGELHSSNHTFPRSNQYVDGSREEQVEVALG